jgi:hypothetical protein
MENIKSNETTLLEIGLTNVQTRVIDRIIEIQRYMTQPCESKIEKQVLKKLPLEVRKTLILNTPSPRWFGTDFQYFNPTVKQRFEKLLSKEEATITHLLPQVDNEPNWRDELKMCLIQKKDPMFPGEKITYLVFENKEESDNAIKEIREAQTFCSIVTDALLPFAEQYHLQTKKLKSEAKLFKKKFGVKPIFDIKNKPKWLYMFEDCMKLQRDFHCLDVII